MTWTASPSPGSRSYCVIPWGKLSFVMLGNRDYIWLGSIIVVVTILENIFPSAVDENCPVLVEFLFSFCCHTPAADFRCIFFLQIILLQTLWPPVKTLHLLHFRCQAESGKTDNKLHSFHLNSLILTSAGSQWTDQGIVLNLAALHQCRWFSISLISCTGGKLLCFWRGNLFLNPGTCTAGSVCPGSSFGRPFVALCSRETISLCVIPPDHFPSLHFLWLCLLKRHSLFLHIQCSMP